MAKDLIGLSFDPYMHFSPSNNRLYKFDEVCNLGTWVWGPKCTTRAQRKHWYQRGIECVPRHVNCRTVSLLPHSILLHCQFLVDAGLQYSKTISDLVRDHKTHVGRGLFNNFLLLSSRAVPPGSIWRLLPYSASEWYHYQSNIFRYAFSSSLSKALYRHSCYTQAVRIPIRKPRVAEWSWL